MILKMIFLDKSRKIVFRVSRISLLSSEKKNTRDAKVAQCSRVMYFLNNDEYRIF
jgi:hypothetical protein